MLAPSPELNRPVAVAMASGPRAGLESAEAVRQGYAPSFPKPSGRASPPRSRFRQLHQHLHSQLDVIPEARNQQRLLPRELLRERRSRLPGKPRRLSLPRSPEERPSFST